MMVVNSATHPTLGKKSIDTCFKLEQEVDWGKWLEAEKVQLDGMYDLYMYDAPTYAQKILKGKGVDYVHTYSSCASQIGMRIFTAIAAWKNYIIVGADATNAYAQLPPPIDLKFMQIYNQYAEWYYNKYGVQLDCNKGQEIFICHQDADFKVAGLDEDMIQDLINTIGG
eukprot:15311505-Ditylum_brightwellii.AAC.1